MSAAERRAVRWLLTGRVQGVGFRHFTRQQADRLGVVGTVANLADGRVEIEAAAEPKTLADFESQVRQGPPSGRVDRLDEQEIADAGWSDFRVIFK